MRHAVFHVTWNIVVSQKKDSNQEIRSVGFQFTGTIVEADHAFP